MSARGPLAGRSGKWRISANGDLPLVYDGITRAVTQQPGGGFCMGVEGETGGSEIDARRLNCNAYPIGAPLSPQNDAVSFTLHGAPP
jgi:hypothetical protein